MRQHEIPFFRRLLTPAILIVAGVPAIFALGLAYVGGLFSPGRLTEATFMQTLAMQDGVHPGFRRNHAKGVCVTGWFAGSGRAVAFSRAAVFATVRSHVIGRFNLAGGMPYQADAPDTIRGVGLDLFAPRGSEWRMALIDLPAFPAATPLAFNGLMLATAPDAATHKPDPAKITAFMTANPETPAALAIIKARPVTSGFADDTFRSLNSFLFVNDDGKATPVRWALVPQQSMGTPGSGQNYLFEDLIKALAHGPLTWKMVVTIGEAGDPIADPTKPWPSSRTQIDAGTLTIDRTESEDGGGRCLGLTFDPTVLPSGITVSDDPFPSARAAAYARSFTLRSGEHKPPSAITPAMVTVGEHP